MQAIRQHEHCAAGRPRRPRAAFRPEEDDPGLEVVGELLEDMRHTGGNEQKIASGERHPLFDAPEYAIAGSDDIGLVLIMRLLRVGPLRSIELDGKLAAFEEYNKRLRRLGARWHPTGRCAGDHRY
jgi:hypothetical protein